MGGSDLSMPPDMPQVVAAVIEQNAGRVGALMPILHGIQERLDCIPDDAIPLIAKALNLSRAEVHGVMHFYHDFRAMPAGTHTVQICRAEACQAMGSRELEAHAQRKLGIAFGETTADGRFTLDPVYCLGNCACTPSIRIDDNIHAGVTPERFDALIEGLRESPGDSRIESVKRAASPALKIFVPMDTTAKARGADAVADAILQEAKRRRIDVELVRNGSRGAFWLEPLVEVDDASGRRAFGPVTPGAVAGLFEAGFPNGSAAGNGSDRAKGAGHPLALGAADEIPWLKRQQRLTFARAGIGDPLSIENYRSLGGFEGLRNALDWSPQTIVDSIKESGLRGRGGAAFPTGIKWQTVLDTPADQKYIVCNADEGDSGTFADRLLMEADPYQLIEGMAIAGIAVGATQGFIYLRSEYPLAARMLEEAIRLAEAERWLGKDIQGSGQSFHLELRIGAGAYICGEETSLLDSLEGKRGLVRYKPPLPAIKGLLGQPTVINNVLSFAAATTVLSRGAKFYKDFGSGRSRGTLTVQLAGNIGRGGLVELPFGHTLRELVEDFGGGTATGRPVRAIQVGGPLGTYLPESEWDVALDYEAFAAISGMLGHGGVVVFDDTVNLAQQARFAMEFCAIESCGKCTPCRIGSVRGVEVIDKIIANDHRAENIVLLQDLCDTMVDGSLCAMGGLTPFPVRSALKHFAGDFER